MAGFTYVFGFTIFSSFESGEVASTGMIPLPQPSESVVGGHAVVCVGYDDARHAFVIRNSWGAGWGDAGYCFMPYAYMLDPGLDRVDDRTRAAVRVGAVDQEHVRESGHGQAEVGARHLGPSLRERSSAR